MRLLLPLLLLVVLPACKHLHTTTDTTTTERTDRSTTVVPRDTLLRVPGGEAHLTVPLPPPGQQLPPRTQRNGKAYVTVSSQNGQLVATGGCDTTAFKATLWDRLTQELREKDTVRTVKETVERKVVPWYAWMAMGASLLVLLGAVFYLLLALLRKRLTLKL